MSGIRVSNVFREESSFCNSGSGDWIAPPPGSYISLSLSRGLNKLYTAGSKTLDTFAYGSLSGSWSWSFTLDYNYLEPLYLAFENSKTDTVKADGGSVMCYEHTFDKKNEGRVPSFEIRRKQMNSLVGGKDETVIAKGCVCKSIKFSMQAGSSQINVSMSGIFADLSLDKSVLTKTDYKTYNGNLPQFACMYIENEYIADVDSISVDIDNGASVIYSTCTPIAKRYSEGQTSYGFSASAYSSDPAKFKQRMFSGGFNNTETAPMKKGLKPIPTIYIKSSNKTADMTTSGDISKNSESVIFTIKSCAVRAMEWQRGDGSKIMEQISGADCKHIYLTIRNNIKDPKTQNGIGEVKTSAASETIGV